MVRLYGKGIRPESWTNYALGVLCITLETKTPLERAGPDQFSTEAEYCAILSAQLDWETQLSDAAFWFQHAGEALARMSRPLSPAVEETMERHVATQSHDFYQGRPGYCYRRWVVWKTRIAELYTTPGQSLRARDMLRWTQQLMERHEHIFTEARLAPAMAANGAAGVA